MLLVLLCWKFFNQSKISRETHFESFSKRTQWDVESKAFLKSIATIETARISFWSSKFVVVWSNFIMAVHLDDFSLKPNWSPFNFSVIGVFILCHIHFCNILARSLHNETGLKLLIDTCFPLGSGIITFSFHSSGCKHFWKEIMKIWASGFAKRISASENNFFKSNFSVKSVISVYKTIINLGRRVIYKIFFDNLHLLLLVSNQILELFYLTIVFYHAWH